MDWYGFLEWTFLICFWAGLAFTLGSALLSGTFHHEFGQGSSFEGGHAADLGGPDVEAGGHTHAGHAQVGWSESQFPGASPWSPTVLSAAVAGFGAAGYLCLVHWKMDVGGSLLIAFGGSIVLGAFMFGVMWWLLHYLQSTSHVTAHGLLGKKVPVSVGIESGQAGAVSIEDQGTLMTAPARAADASVIPAGAEVEIQRVDGGVYVVAETRESWLARSRSKPAHERW